MHIIYARMPDYDWVSVPSDAVARELEKLGHKITIVDNLDFISPSNYDFVWSPYESVTLLGDAISRKLRIPHMAHIEWLPPWRLSTTCNAKEYGFDGDEPELAPGVVIRSSAHYKQVIDAYQNASFRSLGAACFIPYLESTYKIKLKKTSIRYPSIDYNTINNFGNMYDTPKVDNRIITVSRMVKNQRYDVLVDVMNNIKEQCEWVIIGEGPTRVMVEERMKNPNVKLTFLGALWGWERFKWMASSKIHLGCWTGMPPLEAAALKTLPLSVAPNKNSENTSDAIEEYFKGGIALHNYEERKTTMVDAINECLRFPLGETTHLAELITQEVKQGKMGITSCEHNAKELIKLYEN